MCIFARVCLFLCQLYLYVLLSLSFQCKKENSLHILWSIFALICRCKSKNKGIKMSFQWMLSCAGASHWHGLWASVHPLTGWKKTDAYLTGLLVYSPLTMSQSLLHQSSLPTGWIQPWPTLLSNEISSLSKFEYHQRWCNFFWQQYEFSIKRVGQMIFHISPIFLLSDSSPVQEWLYGDHYEGRNHTRVKRGLKHNPMLPEWK